MSSTEIEPCTTLGETRIYNSTDNLTFPQICTYFDASIISNTALSSGLYFFSMCYNGGWSAPYNSDNFCYLSGYIDVGNRAEYTMVVDALIPKFSGLNCVGDPSEISQCGGILTTASCGYVTGLTCEGCSVDNDCLGDDNSICSPDGRCSCRECDNGVCYVGGCLCSDGYQGDTCADRVCTPACQNSGVCQENNTCDCPFPYTGHHCEMEITCNPPCPINSQCFVDEEAETVFCCYGQIDEDDCPSTAPATTPSLPTILPDSTPPPTDGTSPPTDSPTTVAPPIVSLSLGSSEVILLSVFTVGVLCCLVVGLSCLSITLCVVVTIMMKGKKHRDEKSQQFDLSGCIEERKPTIYSAMNEKEMLDYENTPVLPPRETSTYVEMEIAKAPEERKTSHYEVEDDMLEAKTSTDKIMNNTNEMFTIREENTVRDETTFIETPSSVLLFRNDSDWSEGERKYENQGILQDHQS